MANWFSPHETDETGETTPLLRSGEEVSTKSPAPSYGNILSCQDLNTEFHRSNSEPAESPHQSPSLQPLQPSHIQVEQNEISNTETSCRFPTWTQFLALWIEWSSAAVDSVYFIPLLVLLLALPIWIGFFGSRYLLSCPMDSFIPTAFAFMGLFGAAGIMSRIVFIFYKNYWDQENHDDDWDGQRKCIYYGNLIFFVFFIIEWALYLSKTPSFSPKDGNYCHPDFHGMTFYINWSIFCFILFWVLLHGPTLHRILKEFCEHEARISERRRHITPPDNNVHAPVIRFGNDT